MDETQLQPLLNRLAEVSVPDLLDLLTLVMEALEDIFSRRLPNSTGSKERAVVLLELVELEVAEVPVPLALVSTLLSSTELFPSSSPFSPFPPTHSAPCSFPPRSPASGRSRLHISLENL